MIKSIICSLLFLTGLLAQQQEPPVLNSFQFVELPNSGLAVPGAFSCPRLDISSYGFPPIPIVQDTTATITWQDCPTNRYAIVLASYSWDPPYSIHPLLYPAFNPIAFGIAHNTSVMTASWNIPFDLDPLLYPGLSGTVQVIFIDGGLNIIAISNVLQFMIM